jgi:uncharacterized protein
MNKKTVVIGASADPKRYAFKAINKLISEGHEVVAIGKKQDVISGVPVLTGFPDAANVHTVILYIHPRHQPKYFEYIISLKPKRIIFNPGTFCEELHKLALKNGIEIIDDCSLIMLFHNKY